MECLVLKRKYTHPKKLFEGWEYLIANGMSMGKWTSNFGVHCLADTADTKGYLLSQHKEGETLIDTYEVKLKNKP